MKTKYILKAILGINISVSVKDGVYYCVDTPYSDQQYAKRIY